MEPTLTEFREDLIHQLNTSDDIDWDYFLETTNRAKSLADQLGLNKKFNQNNES